MAKLSIHLLGPLQVNLDGEPVTDFATDKVRALLAYLAVEASHAHRRDALAGRLWPDQPHRKARQSLRKALSHLRQAIDDRDESAPFLLVSRDALQFNPDSDHWLDVAAFTSLAQACKEHPHRSEETCLPCIRRLTRMAELYRGDFLEQFFLGDSDVFEEWALLTREWLRREVVEVLARLARYHERRGDYAQARQYSRRQVTLEPWREDAHRRLMRLLVLERQRGAALAQYEACRRALDEELGIEPADETTALCKRIQANELESMREQGSPFHTPTLPHSPTPFVGRTDELKALAERLASPNCRLLTIVGPGGIGKTRLALQAVEEQTGLFAHGVAFVSLVSIGSPDQMVPAIADTLGFSLQGQEAPKEQLLNRLRQRELLLALDGMEHLLEGVELLVEIVRRAPGVILLVTSRECLNVRGEWRYVLEGLTYPQEETLPLGDSTKAATATYSAVELFQQCARQADHRFALSEGEAEHVVHICQLVEGMPLGVELAAAWVATRPCKEIAQEIERNLDALTTPMRDVPGRQRSVRATFDYSWNLLSANEQRLFRRLSVFRGGFPGAAARQVAGASPDQLTALVNKSLVRKDGPNRYGVHELLRQFAAEKLEDPQEEAQTRAEHCCYYADFLQQREEALRKRHDREALDEIVREMGNIRSAWSWAIAQARWEEIEKSAGCLSFFLVLHGPLQEGKALLGAAADRLRTWLDGHARAEVEHQKRQATRLLARLLIEQALLYNMQAAFEQATATAQAATELARQVQDEGLEAAGCIWWGEAHWRQGEYEVAQSLLEQALDRARVAGRPDVEAEGLRHFGNIFLLVGDFAQALSYYKQAARICREIDYRLGEAYVLGNIGYIAFHLGNYAEAQACLEQAMRVYREFGDRLTGAGTLNNLGKLAYRLADFTEARSCCEQALQIWREVGALGEEGTVLDDLGIIFDCLGEYGQARAYSERALGIARKVGDRRNEAVALTTLGLITHHLGDDEAALAYCQEGARIAQELGDRIRQARALTHIGHAQLGLARRAPDADRRSGCLVEAANAYRQAWDVRCELGQMHLALEALAGLAAASLIQGDVEQAMAHVAEILDSLEPTTSLSTYLTCYHVLQAAQNPHAGEILNSAHDLLQKQAARIADETLRRSFLKNVTSHREIASAYQAIEGP